LSDRVTAIDPAYPSKLQGGPYMDHD